VSPIEPLAFEDTGHVVEIPARRSPEQRRQLPTRELVDVQQRDASCHDSQNFRGFALLRRPQRNSKHKIQVQLERAGSPMSAVVGHSPFSARVFTGYAPDANTLSTANRPHRLLDPRSFGEHGLPVDRTDVVQVDID